MKNKSLIISLVLIILIGIILYYIFFSNNNASSKIANYNTQKAEASKDSESNTVTNNLSNKENLQDTKNEDESQNENVSKPEEDTDTKKQPPVETQIATFTTKIYTKDSNRQNNVRLTCSSLNDTTVQNGATFSFCNTVGQATTAKGYKKAEIFDAKR